MYHVWCAIDQICVVGEICAVFAVYFSPLMISLIIPLVPASLENFINYMYPLLIVLCQPERLFNILFYWVILEPCSDTLIPS